MCNRSRGLPVAWQTGLGSGELPRAACQDSRHPFLNLFRAMNLHPSAALSPSARPPLCQHKLRPSQIPPLQEDFQECLFLVSVGRTRKGLLSAPSRETGREDGLDRRPSSQEARGLANPRLSLGPACWTSLGPQGAQSIGEHWGALGHSRELGRARLVFGGQWGISQKGNGPLVPLGLELRPLCSIFPEKPGRGFCSQTRCPSGGWG